MIIVSYSIDLSQLQNQMIFWAHLTPHNHTHRTALFQSIPMIFFKQKKEASCPKKEIVEEEEEVVHEENEWGEWSTHIHVFFCPVYSL